ncbi:MAG: hypothetical protein A2122_01370 [Candidatus Liptonbacteria bacterium GWB1_49_6]|uniref:Uncharacterized protein n=1 Tax=Candidatus Liptonbacteria bacterium GWB1_49_6 TaxID=1798644 RepID=A0A1G2C4P0_9BACT|nr:MAG: hypothetical protein A2122_01370 [Candidatus Liptonbacteria bacterium GWB1_49_6]
MNMAKDSNLARGLGVVVTSLVIGLVFGSWVVSHKEIPTHSTIPFALDPNTEVTKKELLQFLPRTEYEFARIAYGKGQFNYEENDGHNGKVFVSGDVDVVHLAWEAHLDGDGNIWFFLDRKVPQSILGNVHHKFSERNESWIAINDGPHHYSTEIS